MAGDSAGRGGPGGGTGTGGPAVARVADVLLAMGRLVVQFIGGGPIPKGIGAPPLQK